MPRRGGYAARSTDAGAWAAIKALQASAGAGSVDPISIAIADFGAGQNRGFWALNTAYVLNDFVRLATDGGVYRCTTAHTSTGNSTGFPLDHTKWEKYGLSGDMLLKVQYLGTTALPNGANPPAGTSTTPMSTSIWTPKRQYVHPHGKSVRLWNLNATTDILSSSVNLVAPVVDATTPGNALQLQNANLNAGAYTLQSLAAPVNLTNTHVRFPLNVVSGRDNMGATGHRIRLSSVDPFDATNHIWAAVTAQNVAGQRSGWGFQSIPISDFKVAGTGADITAIRTGQIYMDATTSNMVAKYQFIDYHPNTSPKAKCVIWLDDGLDTQANAFPYLIPYNFPATAAFVMESIAEGLPVTFDGARYLQDMHGWQFAIHAYSYNDHTTVMTGVQAEKQIAQWKTAAAAAGLNGAEDLAYWSPGYGSPSVDAVDKIRKTVASARTGQILNTETLPVGDIYATRAVQLTAPTANGYLDYTPYVDAAIACNGLVQFVWHGVGSTVGQTPANNTTVQMFRDLSDYLKSKSSQIDVVTISEALAAAT